MTLRALWRRLEEATRPVYPETAQAMRRRWEELPAGVRTPEQVLGRNAVGCEGTHGVFPRCNLTCSPCYHSRDANHVRVDGAHTVAAVTEQMRLLRRRRGPRAHAQLIGGEVSLLAPDDHAAALAAMRAHGREPMSMTHGDFDYAYLRALALGPDGRRRFHRLSFAVHVDSLMRGRRGAPRPRRESDLDGHRAAFVAMFRRLRREHGVRSFLAHNMTVTPSNLPQVRDVVRTTSGLGFGMLSFQPAAQVGDERRWREDFGPVGIDEVWREIEAGLGQRVAWQGLQFGDPRCNRTAFGALVGRRWVPLFDPDDAADLRARDRALDHLGGIDFRGTPLPLLVVKLLRVLVRHPEDLPLAAHWAGRLVRRCGGPVRAAAALLRRRVQPLTFVVHRFMDAEAVRPAWALLQQGVAADDPPTRAVQERLQACSYTMAHPETGELVPACVQHSVLDPGENAQLRRLLPLTVL